MPDAASPPPGRDYSQLLGAMNELLAVLSSDGGEEAALRASFEAAARGFRAQKALLLVIDLPEVLCGTPNPKAGPLLAEGVVLSDAVEAFERELILSRLEQHGGNVKAARESLGLTKTTFHRYMRRLGIETGISQQE